MNTFIIFCDEFEDPIVLHKKNLLDVCRTLDVEYGIENYYSIFQCVANADYDPEVKINETFNVFDM